MVKLEKFVATLVAMLLVMFMSAPFSTVCVSATSTENSTQDGVEIKAIHYNKMFSKSNFSEYYDSNSNGIDVFDYMRTVKGVFDGNYTIKDLIILKSNLLQANTEKYIGYEKIDLNSLEYNEAKKYIQLVEKNLVDYQTSAEYLEVRGIYDGTVYELKFDYISESIGKPLVAKFETKEMYYISWDNKWISSNLHADIGSAAVMYNLNYTIPSNMQNFIDACPKIFYTGDWRIEENNVSLMYKVENVDVTLCFDWNLVQHVKAKEKFSMEEPLYKEIHIKTGLDRYVLWLYKEQDHFLVVDVTEYLI